MFLLMPAMLRQGVGFWPSLGASCGVTVALNLGSVWLLPKIGIVGSLAVRGQALGTAISTSMPSFSRTAGAGYDQGCRRGRPITAAVSKSLAAAAATRPARSLQVAQLRSLVQPVTRR